MLKALLLFPALISAQTFTESPDLNRLAEVTARRAIQQFSAGGLTSDCIAITVIDMNNAMNNAMNDRQHPVWGSFHGEAPFYPASVVKLFYLNAVHAWMESGKLQETPELARAIHDMIVSSSNDATGLVVDMLTDTTGGPEMTPQEMQPWLEKRNAVNRYYAGLGYQGINVNQKTFAEDSYGRERQNRGPEQENGNRLTTNATARLFFSIATLNAVSHARSLAMMNLLRRDPFAPKSDNPDEQALQFMGKSLPAGSQYYSKAGWTSTARHDSAFIRLPNGAEYIAVVFTRNNSKQEGIIPLVSKLLVDHFLAAPPSAHTISSPTGTCFGGAGGFACGF